MFLGPFIIGIGYLFGLRCQPVGHMPPAHRVAVHQGRAGVGQLDRLQSHIL